MRSAPHLHDLTRSVIGAFYKGLVLKRQRIDMIVDDAVVVEGNASHELPAGARRQLYNYLRGTNLEVGLLLHFGVTPRACREICFNHRKVRLPERSAVTRVSPGDFNSLMPAGAAGPDRRGGRRVSPADAAGEVGIQAPRSFERDETRWSG